MKLAIYDFDGTYVSIQTLPYLYKLWKSMKINHSMHRRTWSKIMVRYVFHKLRLPKWNKQYFRSDAMALTADLFGSVPPEELNRFLQAFYEHMQHYISEDIKSQLLDDKLDGYHTILLSGNYAVILKPFLVDGFDTVLGTIWKTEIGYLTSTEVDIVIHDKKRELIQSTFPDADLQKSKAYADSHYDLPILEAVGEAICVNPDPALESIAQERGYRIWTI